MLMVPSLVRAESSPQTVEEYKDYFTKVESLITQDLEKSCNQYMNFFQGYRKLLD